MILDVLLLSVSIIIMNILIYCSSCESYISHNATGVPSQYITAALSTIHRKCKVTSEDYVDYVDTPLHQAGLNLKDHEDQ